MTQLLLFPTHPTCHVSPLSSARCLLLPLRPRVPSLSSSLLVSPPSFVIQLLFAVVCQYREAGGSSWQLIAEIADRYAYSQYNSAQYIMPRHAMQSAPGA